MNRSAYNFAISSTKENHSLANSIATEFNKIGYSAYIVPTQLGTDKENLNLIYRLQYEVEHVCILFSKNYLDHRLSQLVWECIRHRKSENHQDADYLHNFLIPLSTKERIKKHSFITSLIHWNGDHNRLITKIKIITQTDEGFHKSDDFPSMGQGR